MSSWNEIVSWAREAVLECESAPDLICKVLDRETASEKGGTEEVDPVIYVAKPDGI
jgi:hypothetical protein